MKLFAIKRFATVHAGRRRPSSAHQSVLWDAALHRRARTCAVVPLADDRPPGEGGVAVARDLGLGRLGLRGAPPLGPAPRRRGARGGARRGRGVVDAAAVASEARVAERRRGSVASEWCPTQEFDQVARGPSRARSDRLGTPKLAFVAGVCAGSATSRPTPRLERRTSRPPDIWSKLPGVGRIQPSLVDRSYRGLGRNRRQHTKHKNERKSKIHDHLDEEKH